mgnify:CR=1 FL=1
MAILTIKKNAEFADYTPGWKTLVVKSAVKGKYEGGNQGKYMDLFFEDYPDNLKLRLHHKINPKNNEEFIISNAFRHANAGITDSSEGETEIRAEIITEPEHIIGKSIQAYFFKNAKGYTDISDKVVPAAPFKNIVEEWDQARIDGYKTWATGKIKEYISKYVTTNDDNSTEESWG